MDETLSDNLCICDTKNTYQGWLILESNPSVQNCLSTCPIEYNIDSITKKCYYLCDAQNDFIFNDICYKNDCPEGTYLKYSNSRTCYCRDIIETDPQTGFMTCSDIYPDLFYTDRKNCPYVYKKNCVLKCPDQTCLTTTTKELVKCVDYKPKTMTIYNGICIEGLKEYVQTIDDYENDDDILPIITASGVVLHAFSTDASMEELIKKYPNLTFVELGECKEKLREAYNLPPNTKLYIVGIDSPNLYGNSSINVFDYEVYLRNGTQLDDISSCDGIKIIISSNINDLNIINYYKAIEFYELDGYDIYNKTDNFYLDYCTPAQDDGNDITLEDRIKYYYPNVSICNEGCSYQMIDYNKKRFICNCNANLSEGIYEYYNEEENASEEEDQTYVEYFLSLINYKIVTCYNLFFEFKNFYSNAGFYISLTTSLVCLVLFFIFWVKGLKHIRIIMYKNIPTLPKLKEIIRKQEEKMKKRYNTYEDFDIRNINDISNNNSGSINNNDLKTNNKLSKNIIITHNNCISNNNSNINSNVNTKNSPFKGSEFSKKSLFLKDIDFGKNGEKEVELFNIYKKKEKKKKHNYKDFIKEQKSRESNSSRENLVKLYSKYINEKSKNLNQKDFNKKEKKDICKLTLNKNIINETNQKIKSLIHEENDSKEFISSRILHKNVHKNNTTRLAKNKINIDNIQNKNKNESGYNHLIGFKQRMVDDLELKIDFNFDHLIDRTDDEVEKRELNNIPYRQALRIDKRHLFEIFISVFINEIEILNLFLYRNPYSHYSLSISIYLHELLLDLTMNCFLYTDDIVSEKYHNNGQLSMITSLSLSIMSNIISSIIVYIISKLTNYCDIIEAIIKNVKLRRRYFENIIRLFRYIKVRLGLFYFLQLGTLLLMIYYLFIFCAIYHKTQVSIMINYIIGALTSLVFSIGLTIIITLLRAISIKYRSVIIYNISKYLYEHF